MMKAAVLGCLGVLALLLGMGVPSAQAAHLKGISGTVGDPTLPKKVTFKKVAKDVYVYMRAKGRANSYLVMTKAGGVVIDALTTPAQSRDALKHFRTVTKAPIRYLIITHRHSDHYFGAQTFSPPAAIVASQTLYNHYTKKLKKEFAFRKRINKGIDLSEVKVVLPHIILRKGTTDLRVGGELFRIYHWGRGQTEGALFIHMPGKRIVFTGDTFNRKSINYMGGMASYGGWKNILTRLENLDVDRYMAGHGHPATKADVADYRSMIAAFHDGVLEGVKSGTPVETLLATMKMRQFQGYRNYGRFVHRNIKGLYKRFSKELKK